MSFPLANMLRIFKMFSDERIGRIDEIVSANLNEESAQPKVNAFMFRLRLS